MKDVGRHALAGSEVQNHDNTTITSHGPTYAQIQLLADVPATLSSAEVMHERLTSATTKSRRDAECGIARQM